MTLRLRPAVDTDETFLFTLRTDPEVARQSEYPAPTRVEHAQWFCAARDDPNRHVYIVEDTAPSPVAEVDSDGQRSLWERAGTARLDLVASEAAWVSLALCPQARGWGYGKQVLALLETEARARGIKNLHAWVKPQNTASLRIFSAAGYDFVGRGPEICFASKEVA